MKTLTNFFNKLHGLIIVVLLYPFLLTSCNEVGKEMIYAKPSQNPVTLSAAAQTINLEVKNLASIKVENSNSDTYSENMSSQVVKNDWITITWLFGATNDKSITIEVKENTSDKSRTYNLGIIGMPGKSTLQIIQNGK